MTAETVVVLVVVMLGMLLAIWGASLVVRALASRASSVAMRLARRIPKRINTAPPTLSRVQFAFGMIVGPIACVAGVGLCAFVVGAIAFDGQEFRWSMIPPLVLVVFAAAALVVGIRWDRANGRRRCPKCWYDYAGLGDAAACPECGHVPTSARALARTRRSRPIMLAAPVLLIAAWLAHVTPVAIRTSWRAFVPTTVLIGFFEYMPQTVLSNNWRGDDASLEARVMDQELFAWQRRWLTSRSRRLVDSSSDTKTCAFALHFLQLDTSGWSLEDDDATAAHVFRVGMASAKSTDPKVSMYSAALLAQSAMSSGPKMRVAVAEHLTDVLARFQQPTGVADHAVFGRLIAGSAPAEERVVACVRAVALDPQWRQERRDHASAVLGTLASRYEPLHGRLKEEYAASQGATREMLALALVSARIHFAPHRGFRYSLEDDPATGQVNSRLIADAMRDDDLEIRRAAAKVIVATRLTPFHIDLQQTLSDLSDLATSDPACAAIAIHSMGWNGGVTDRVVPVIAEVLKDGTNDEVALIAAMLKWQQMDADWVAIQDPLNQRVNDATLDQATLTALAEAKTQLDSLVPPQVSESNAVDADR